MNRGTLLGIVLMAGAAASAGAQTAQIHLLWALGEVSPQGVSADGSVTDVAPESDGKTVLRGTLAGHDLAMFRVTLAEQ